jgi:hypothetical protein
VKKLDDFKSLNSCFSALLPTDQAKKQPKLSKFTLPTSQVTLQIWRRVSLVHLTAMEFISEPWHEDACEAVEGVMDGPEDASQGNNGFLRKIISVVKAVRTAVSEISDIKVKYRISKSPLKACCLTAVLLCYFLVVGIDSWMPLVVRHSLEKCFSNAKTVVYYSAILHQIT